MLLGYMAVCPPTTAVGDAALLVDIDMDEAARGATSYRTGFGLRIGNPMLESRSPASTGQ